MVVKAQKNLLLDAPLELDEDNEYEGDDEQDQESEDNLAI